MCGIVGILDGSSGIANLENISMAMTRALTHRGPDDEGLEQIGLEPSVWFGHRRLAIIDLSAAGHQPMHDPDTGAWVTFNGEIYNFRELRSELEGKGHRFSTSTDTEVILKGYAQWGSESVRRLRGIFAFGLWDPNNCRLLLARDHLGVKPLYYWRHDDALLFASEVRALLASGIVPRRLDLAGLRSFLSYGSVQEPLTLVQGVQSLLPGHTLTWNNDIIQVNRYWGLPPADAVQEAIPPDLFEQLSWRLEEAVRLQLVADVPLGAFLSGGIDSTAIAALMRRAARGPVKTFSIVFDEMVYDERTYARTAAQHIGTEHSELLLRCEDVCQLLPKALAAYDQPSCDGLNTYFVSRATHDAGLTVALSGLGGDELFGGYDEYNRPLLAERWGSRLSRLPVLVRNSLAGALSLYPRKEAIRKLIALLTTNMHPYFIARQALGCQQIEQILVPEVLEATSKWQPLVFARLERETAGYDPINRASALELQTFMLSTLLRDTDQMSMAHGLEVRVPLLDHRLVEYVFSLPGGCKLEKGQPKPLLTRPLNGTLPRRCVYRPKRGFEFPFSVWLRETLGRQIQSSLEDQDIEAAWPFTPQGLNRIWQDFQAGVLGWSRVWGVFVLRHWLSAHRIE